MEVQSQTSPDASAAHELVPGLISVVMPMRNCEAFVREAIESILAEKSVPLELVVIDDGSTDRSADVVRKIGDDRIRLVPGPQKGIAAALNAGLAVARGEYFARCDADDFYASNRLAAQRQLLETRPELGAVCGIYNHVTDTGQHITDQTPSKTAEGISHELKNGAGRTHLCTFLVRMKHLRELGGFRPYFIGTEDADFQLRLGEVCEVWYEPRVCYHYRLHGQSITHTQPSAERQFLEKMARVSKAAPRDRSRRSPARQSPAHPRGPEQQGQSDGCADPGDLCSGRRGRNIARGKDEIRPHGLARGA